MNPTGISMNKFSRIRLYPIILLGIIFLLPCCRNKGDNYLKQSETRAAVIQTEETKEMAQMLKELVTKGNPKFNYHWNKKLASSFKLKMEKATNQTEFIELWYQYVSQLLNSGDSESSIREIEAKLMEWKMSYSDVLDKGWVPILDVLGLAYLRLGEQENCINNHNEYVCIIPVQKEAVHEIEKGSRKAIEIYSQIYERYPDDKYKWLINLAYMTLGEHPSQVPASVLVSYPNWDMEKRDFPKFRDIAPSLGVNTDGLSGGVCLDDFNNDGIIDIFSTSYGMEDQPKLFLGSEEGTFNDWTENSGILGIVGGLNCLQADYDNDGDKDILILRGGWLRKGGEHPNSLLRNNGDGKFEDVTKSSGLLSFHPTQTAAWADVNKDGYLDLFIGNEFVKREGEHSCELYINQGDGTFKEEAKEYGLGGIDKYVKGVAFGDINNDLWPDLYISVMGGKNLLFKNDNGKFISIGKKARIQEPMFSFPCWFWDVNNDGLQDIFVSGYDPRNMNNLSADFSKELQGKEVLTDKPRLYINNGDETFSNQTEAYGLNKTMYAMGANHGDINNDGYLDFYVGTGAPDLSTVVPNRMFLNQEGKEFKEVTSAGLFGHIQKGHGIGFADINRDGNQEIYAVMGGAYEGDTFTNILFQNPISANNWVVLELKGKSTNSDAIGSLIEIECQNGRKIYHTIGTGGSFGSNSLQAEIGLGTESMIKNLNVKWQNGEAQQFGNIPVNKKYLIIEGDSLKEVTYRTIVLDFAKTLGHN